ncbi:MAG TPA: adenylate kinase [Candidatus Acidoferrales bacterium]|nr:adenylate kinase [Candidatus Acidoferrales bacterium]
MADVTAERGTVGNSQGLGRAVILLGPPGAGKGTQAQRISQRYHLPHLSTGDMFRDNIQRDTELGRKAKPLMERGELVPDEIVLGMVEERIGQPDCAIGFVFDGFPRTLRQADDLERICRQYRLGCTIVLHMVVDPALLMRRLTGRRICKAGGHIYNVYERPPKHEGICDIDGSELIHRPDDSEGVIGERLAAYDRQTQPLVEYYTLRGLLSPVDAMADADRVTEAIARILDGAIAHR